MSKSNFNKTILIWIFLAVFVVVSALISIHVGIAQGSWNTEEGRLILLQIRLPRTILALLVGMALSLAGASFQALLRNPLADPQLLGVSAGGALGVVIGSGFILAGSLAVSIPLMSAAGSLVAVLVVYRLSLRKGALSLYTLLLVGVMLNSLFISTIIFLQSLVRSDELVTVLFWLLGSLTFTNYTRLLIVAVILASCAIPLILNARKMNLLSMGESTAQALGVDIEKTKRSIFFLAALLTAMAVSVSGIIGFVGLVVPHLTRSLLGSDYRKTLPACVLLGGGVLLWSDILARMLIRPQELPVGVITSFLGVPFFIYFMKRKESKRIL